jgi:hypothetical protein
VLGSAVVAPAIVTIATVAIIAFLSAVPIVSSDIAEKSSPYGDQ